MLPYLNANILLYMLNNPDENVIETNILFKQLWQFYNLKERM